MSRHKFERGGDLRGQPGTGANFRATASPEQGREGRSPSPSRVSGWATPKSHKQRRRQVRSADESHRPKG